MSAGATGGASGATTGTNRSVAATVTPSTLLLAANALRKGATFYQDDTASSLYISLGAVCTTTNFTIKLAPGGFFTPPANYQGVISGVWSAATGSARVTELT